MGTREHPSLHGLSCDDADADDPLAATVDHPSGTLGVLPVPAAPAGALTTVPSRVAAGILRPCTPGAGQGSSRGAGARPCRPSAGAHGTPPTLRSGDQFGSPSRFAARRSPPLVSPPTSLIGARVRAKLNALFSGYGRESGGPLIQRGQSSRAAQQVPACRALRRWQSGPPPVWTSLVGGRRERQGTADPTTQCAPGPSVPSRLAGTRRSGTCVAWEAHHAARRH